MSLEHDDQMIDRLSSNFQEVKSKEEKTLEELQHSKQELMAKQNKEFLEELFKDNASTPINVKNIQVTNSQSFRNTFLQKQLQPLLSNNLTTLTNLTENIDQVTHNFTKLGLVENLLVSLNPIPKTYFNRGKPSIDLVPIFNIIPVKRFYAKTGTNIGNGEGDGYIQFQIKNIFGGAENITFDAITGTRTQSSYLLNYNQPIFNNANYIWENLAYLNIKKLHWLNSDLDVKGITNKIYTQYKLPINHELILENCWRCLTNNQSKSLDVLNQLGNNFKSSIMYNWRYETRNNIHLPTSGKFIRLGIEYSGLWSFNSSHFIKSVMESQFAYKFNKLHSIILSCKSGLIFSTDNATPVLDRFYIGGPNDVRAFTLNGLGPKNYNSSIGGDVFLNGGISLISKFPRVSDDSNFKIHNFINFGKLLPLDKSKTSLATVKNLTTQFSVGYGFGVLYNHPMARFELNFVLPIASHERDYIRKGLQYGIGISFL